MTAKNNYDYTGASRQAAYVERLKAKGLKQTQVWAHPDDVLKIKKGHGSNLFPYPF